MLWVIVGAGAQGRITLDVLRAARPRDDAVFLDDDPARAGRRLCGVEIIDRARLRSRLDPERMRALVAVGHNGRRLRLAAELAALGVPFGTLAHPSAVVMPSATLGAGVMICPAAVVGSGARVGDHALIDTAAVVEHDCVVGEGASLAPGVKTGGRVVIGAGAFVGVGAVLNPRVTVGAGAVVGAGSVVTRDVRPGVLAYGVPAREVRPVDPERDWAKLL